ncbi:MAG: hypothetical protein FD155_259 [Bacteroidetes bacterium]|nr:MAG: hypothetical protein FD155_259 [Bacteroidota bacterium]
MDATALLRLNFGGLQVLRNESGILISFSLIYNIIRDINFEDSCFKKNCFVSQEIYNSSLFILNFDNSQSVIILNTFNLLDRNYFIEKDKGRNISLFNFRASNHSDFNITKMNRNGSISYVDWFRNAFNRYCILLFDNLYLKKVLKGYGFTQRLPTVA